MKLVELFERMAKEPQDKKKPLTSVEWITESRLYKLWNPRNLQVGRHEIRGRITRLPVLPLPRPGDRAETVAFRTVREGFDNDNGRFEQLLRRAGIDDANGLTPEPHWRLADSLIFVFGGLVLVLGFFIIRRRS